MKFRYATRPDQQAGFGVITALFILIIISLLVSSMLKISQLERQASAHEALAVRSFYAAESGAQWAMRQLFLNLDPIDPVAGPTCADVESAYPNGASANWSEQFMSQCRLVEHVVCRQKTLVGLADSISSYHISSTAECGDDVYTARRTVSMEATRLLN